MTLWTGPRTWLLFFALGSTLTGSLSAHAVNLNYVSPEIRQHLEMDFNNSKSTYPKSLHSNWICEMFGVRSGLQHEKNVPLYHLQQLKDGHYQNDGASPSKVLSLNEEKTELKGKSRQVTELLRMKSPSEIIAKFVHTKSQQVVAFAKCAKQDEKNLTTASNTQETISAHD